MSNSFDSSSIAGWNDGDFFAAFQDLTYGGGTYTPKKLPAAVVPPAIPARNGAAGPSALPTSGGGGIDSPLTEELVNGRAYYTERLMYSTDGLVYCKWAPIKDLNMYDANNAAIVLTFRDQT